MACEDAVVKLLSRFGRLIQKNRSRIRLQRVSEGAGSPNTPKKHELGAPQVRREITALLHHVTIDLLKDACSWLKREAAPGVDGRTWQSYKQNLEANLVELHSRIHRGHLSSAPFTKGRTAATNA
jgi:hypothetical protein